MTPAFRIRLAILVVAIGLVAGLTIWGVQNTWHRIRLLEDKLNTGHLESFRLADDFRQRLLNLSSSMVRYASRREEATWIQFEQASATLDRWIDDQDPKLNTEGERVWMRKLADAYDDYLRAANRLHTNQQPAMVSAEAFAQLNEFDLQAQRLLQIGIQLADAHRVAEEAFLGDANQSLTNLRTFLFGGVAFLLLLVAALGGLLFRDMIAPLRTKLVEHEALLERQEKLATLGTLAAGIAHEIRNPLTSIKARLYTLDKHIKGNEFGVADTAIISSEISRLERIVQDVLRFARPSDPEIEMASGNQLLEELRALTAGALESVRVQLVVEPSPTLNVPMDTALIKQVLVNLVRNACEAIEGPGVVTIRVRSAELRIRDELEPVAIFEVTDTGKGIPAEVEKRLFDPFFTTKEVGTGLGLSIAARIVERHGGSLRYQTRLGHGTTFGIVLPLKPAKTGKK